MSTKTKSKQVHVVPSSDGWKVVRTEASRASGVFANKTEAQKRARELARKDSGTVVTHRRDGRMRKNEEQKCFH
jgi:hypothetical protein